MFSANTQPANIMLQHFNTAGSATEARRAKLLTTVPCMSNMHVKQRNKWYAHTMLAAVKTSKYAALPLAVELSCMSFFVAVV